MKKNCRGLVCFPQAKIRFGNQTTTRKSYNISADCYDRSLLRFAEKIRVWGGLGDRILSAHADQLFQLQAQKTWYFF